MRNRNSNQGAAAYLSGQPKTQFPTFAGRQNYSQPQTSLGQFHNNNGDQNYGAQGINRAYPQNIGGTQASAPQYPEGYRTQNLQNGNNVGQNTLPYHHQQMPNSWDPVAGAYQLLVG